MKREHLSDIISNIDEGLVAQAARYAPDLRSGSPERIVHMKKKRIVSIALAAALILALGVTAFAVWNIHAARQQELKADLKIVENNVSSYTEYAVDNQAGGLVLLSAVNDGFEQHVYVNISPVTKEEAARFPADVSFSWRIGDTEIGGFAGPQLPVELSLSGENAYDEESQTITLQCNIDVKFMEKAMAELGTENVPLQVQMIVGEDEPKTFGPVSISLTEEQSRYFDFGHAIYHDTELDREIEIAGLELTPFSAVWKVSYDGAASFHTPEADWAAYEPWSMLEDKVCIEAKLIFSDGSVFSTGGAMTTPYENGVVNLNCEWGGAIDVDDVQRIVLGDVVLWEAR